MPRNKNELTTSLVRKLQDGGSMVMDGLLIRGGAPLKGTLPASGSKNASLAILAASLLADGPVTLGRVPFLRDIDMLCQVLKELGVCAEREAHGRLKVETINSHRIATSKEYTRRMRASFSVLGPLVAKRGRAVVCLPGGCNLGPRPIDLHLRGLAALGATIYLSGQAVDVRARRLRGARINLLGPCGPTVTGTMNVLCAATLAAGVTVIEGAASEPEVRDLGNFLQRMGADISGLGTPEITVRGVEQLRGVAYDVEPDRIETATWLLAAALTGGSVTVTGANAEHHHALFALLRGVNAAITITPDAVSLSIREKLRGFECVAAPYPGIPTDLQPLLVALATQAEGRSVIQDTVFPRRFAHAAELRRLGADMQLRPGVVEVSGAARLVGTEIAGQDLRGAAALALVALVAEGETLLRGATHLDRGYQDFAARLRLLGGEARRVDSRRLAYASPR